MGHYPTTHGTPLTLARCCTCLGLNPPLQPGQKVTWFAMNPDTDVGINAEIRCFDPAREDEPYVLSVAVYERMRTPAPSGRDYGVENVVVAVLDFALDLPEGEDPQPLDDPPNACLKLAKAERAPVLEDRPLEEALGELQGILASWPAEWDRG